MRQKLQIGVLLDSFKVQAWEYRILENIINSDFSCINLLFINDSKILSDQKLTKSMGQIIRKFHESLDKVIFKNNPDYSRLIDSSVLLKDITKVDKATLVGTADESVMHLDIILNLSSCTFEDGIMNLPRFGIWSLKAGNDQITPGYEEVVMKKPVTGSVLEIIGYKSERPIKILCSWEPTYLYSVNINRNRLFWRASVHVPRIMSEMFRYGESYLTGLIEKRKINEDIDRTDHFKSPSFFKSLYYLLNFFLVTVRQTFKKIFYTDAFNWILFYQIKKVDKVLLNSFAVFQKLESTRDKFWADPFVVSRNQKYYIFVEELIYKTNKGHISVIVLDNEGNFLGSEKIIEKPYHLSYPFIFEINDCFYMIPESSQNKTVDLYKCSEFPYKWEFSKTLMENMSAVDTTLFFHYNKWWLFTSIDGTNGISGGSTELYLYYSDDPFSDDWKSHPCNPVISDVRTARPAGNIFVQDGKIYRPSQDCSVRYGKGFNLNQITLLSETDYDEILVEKVEPTWNKRLKGAHTFNFDNDFTIIDTYAYRSRISF